MRSLTKHVTYSVPSNSNLNSGISKKIVSTELDAKMNRIEAEKIVSISEIADECFSQQERQQIVITDKMKHMSTDEIFERLVREHVDFRDVRYQELMGQFEDEMSLFKKNAPSFEELPGSNAQLSNSSLNQNQSYTQMQSKFYNLRKRDQADIQERQYGQII